MSRTIAILFMSFLWSCKPSIEIPNFDKKEWVKDKAGCHYRIQTVNNILEHKSLFKNKREKDIRLVLGEPDRQDLYVRGQKFFYYTVNSPSICNNGDSTALEFRFSALGMISEVMKIEL